MTYVCERCEDREAKVRVKMAWSPHTWWLCGACVEECERELPGSLQPLAPFLSVEARELRTKQLIREAVSRLIAETPICKLTRILPTSALPAMGELFPEGLIVEREVA